MTYRFSPDEDVAAAARRVSEEQLGEAAARLRHDVADDAVAAVHDARKAVKKERALVRLVRGAVPRGARRQENRALREAARGLSGARDAEVLVETLDGLAERYAGMVPATAFTAVREPLVRARSEARAQLADPQLPETAADRLEAAGRRIAVLPMRGTGFAALMPGLSLTYRRGRRAFGAARSDPAAERLHAWRKRVKDLWYQLRLLSDVGGEIVAGHAKDAHALADLLGDEHDLAVLREALDALPALADDVVALIDRRRAELAAEAFGLGRRVYAEKRRHFAARMRSSLKAADSGARTPA